MLQPRDKQSFFLCFRDVHKHIDQEFFDHPGLTLNTVNLTVNTSVFYEARFTDTSK